ncbi:hypothetical protein [Pseudomonas mucidolens]|uniref:hypothetical protein n=1 Tax=Pseudomonas mucidolens TaxID=46679 RepID=UPI0010327E68
MEGTSKYARRNAQCAMRNASAANLDYADASSNLSVSYAYRVSRGIYLQTALIHLDNPAFAPKRDSFADHTLRYDRRIL